MRCFQQKAEQLPVRSTDEMQLLSEGVLPVVPCRYLVDANSKFESQLALL